MNIEGENYAVKHPKDSAIVSFEGTIRLGGMQEYAEILDLMNTALDESGNAITLDVKGLKLLNSSGITMMSKFVIGCRGKQSQLKIVASKDVPWQGKSLKNLQRLLPSIELVVE